MLTDVLSVFLHYFLLVVTAVTVENCVVERGLGISRLISLLDEDTDNGIFSILITANTTIAGLLHYFLYNYAVKDLAIYPYIQPLCAVACMAVAFFIVFILAIKLMPNRHVAKAAAAMPLSAFNCTVIGTVLLSTTSSLGLVETLIFCLASGLGFILALIFVREAQRRISLRDVPAAFKGLPATLLYLAGLALAVYGLTGHTFSL